MATHPRLRTPDVLVVGGGAIGVCIAYELAGDGASVALVERGPRLASGCSAGNAGLIHPSHSAPLATPRALREGIVWALRRDSPLYLRPRPAVVPWLLRFAAASTPARARSGTAVMRSLAQASLELHAGLAASGVETGFERRGVLHVYETDNGFAAGRADAEASVRAGFRAQILGRDDARELEPTISDVVRGAAFYPDEAQCDPVEFVEAVGRAAADRGAELTTRTQVVRLRPRGRRVEVVETTAGDLRAGQVVLAAGAWTPQLTRGLRMYLPIEGGKGYHIDIGSGETPPRVPVFMHEARAIATPYADRVRLAGTLELAGLDLTIDPVRIAAIRAAARRNLTGMNGDLRSVWAGLRPCAPDGLPIVGRPAHYDDVVVATGHAMMGLTLAPVTGRLVAELLAGATPSHDLGPLAPDRFRRFELRPRAFGRAGRGQERAPVPAG